jgi:hypothetical protein
MGHGRGWPTITILLAACASERAARAPSPGASESSALSPLEARFPRPRARLQIEANDPGGLGEDGVPLRAVVARMSDATGVVFSTSPLVEKSLAETRVKLSQPVVVQPDAAYPWFESLLVQSDFYLAASLETEPPLVAIHSWRLPQGTPREVPSVTIAPDEIAFCREHPAVLVTTMLELPHVDVRVLGNSLRGLQTNPTGGGVMPVANTNAVLISGTGQTVAMTIELLLRADAAAAKGQDPGAAMQGAA